MPPEWPITTLAPTAAQPETTAAPTIRPAARRSTRPETSAQTNHESGPIHVPCSRTSAVGSGRERRIAKRVTTVRA